jgi:hypothetical protein
MMSSPLKKTYNIVVNITSVLPLVKWQTKLTSLITFFKRGPCGLLCCRVATQPIKDRVK